MLLRDGHQACRLLRCSYPPTLHRKSLVIPVVRRAAHMLAIVDARGLPISESYHVVFPFGHDLAIDAVDGVGVGVGVGRILTSLQHGLQSAFRAQYPQLGGSGAPEPA